MVIVELARQHYSPNCTPVISYFRKMFQYLENGIDFIVEVLDSVSGEHVDREDVAPVT